MCSCVRCIFTCVVIRFSGGFLRVFLVESGFFSKELTNGFLFRFLF